MGSTNSTPNFKFPLFTDTDKPTWRGDVNGMSNKLESALDSVVATSNSASTLATTALGQSNDAKITAGNAVTTANNAVTTAEDAKKVANSATATSATALSKANEATSTANNAKTIAESASTVANGISAKADSANTKSASALEKATTALSTVNAVEIKVDNLENEIANSDTQWTAIPSNSYKTGVTPGTTPPSYRIINNVVYWSGWVNVANVNLGWTSLFTLPAVTKPVSDSIMQFMPVGSVMNIYTGGAYIGANNEVDVYSESAKTGAAIRLGGSYPLG